MISVNHTLREHFFLHSHTCLLTIVLTASFEHIIYYGKTSVNFSFRLKGILHTIAMMEECELEEFFNDTEGYGEYGNVYKQYRRKSNTSSIGPEILLQVEDISLNISSSMSSISTITSTDSVLPGRKRIWALNMI